MAGAPEADPPARAAAAGAHGGDADGAAAASTSPLERLGALVTGLGPRVAGLGADRFRRIAAAGAPDGAAAASLQRLRSRVKERPELGVAGAFVGGLVLATILKRLVRR